MGQLALDLPRFLGMNGREKADELLQVIGIGDNEFSYFCFPKTNCSVTKARLAAEELYNMKKPRRDT